MNPEVAQPACVPGSRELAFPFSAAHQCRPGARATNPRPGRRRWFASVVCAFLALGGLASHGQTVLIDFGADATPTLLGPAPNDPLNQWNNVPIGIGGIDNGAMSNLVTTMNTPTGIGLMMVSRFNGVNEGGTTASTLYPPNATRDSFFGNTEPFFGVSNIFPSFKLTGLAADTVYHFTFYASRTGAADNRETGYTVTGGNSGFAALDPANNIDNFTSVSGITPDASGEITISLAATANNNNANHFTYLGVLKIDAVAPQTPIGFTLQPVNTRVAQFEPVTFSAAVTGAPPYFVQWLSNDVAIPNANQFSYTIPSTTLDMNGSLFSVNVSNLAYSITSSNALLRVISDTNPPVLLSVASPDGRTITVTFNEALEPNTAADPFNYGIHESTLGDLGPLSAELRPDGTNVLLTLAASLSGVFTVTVNNVQDLSGNPVAPESMASGRVPGPEEQAFLFDFGANATTTGTGPSPDDPLNTWNNVTTDVGSTDTGVLLNLLTTAGGMTDVGLVMMSRFNGANTAGTLASPLFPIDATRDSLFGNTELFGGLSNIFPSFKLTGLLPSLSYSFTFYASRTGASDNRETGYTLTGANNGFAALNAANNITNIAVASGIRPTSAGEITISLAPGPNNNNASHFTYLGVLRVQPSLVPPQFLTPTVSGGMVTLNWIENGLLEWAPTVLGPWTAYDPAPAPPYSEAVVAGASRFFRLRAAP